MDEFAKTDPQSAEKIKRYIVTQKVRHRGPMPSPQTLKDYALIQSDLPERMMRMAENSLASSSAQNEKLLSLKDKELDVHMAKLDYENIAHKREIGSQNLSLSLAFIALTICVVGSFYLATIGHKELALLLGGSTVVAVVGAFLKRKLK